MPIIFHSATCRLFTSHQHAYYFTASRMPIIFQPAACLLFSSQQHAYYFPASSMPIIFRPAACLLFSRQQQAYYFPSSNMSIILNEHAEIGRKRWAKLINVCIDETCHTAQLETTCFFLFVKNERVTQAYEIQLF